EVASPGLGRYGCLPAGVEQRLEGLQYLVERADHGRGQRATNWRRSRPPVSILALMSRHGGRARVPSSHALPGIHLPDSSRTHPGLIPDSSRLGAGGCMLRALMRLAAPRPFALALLALFALPGCQAKIGDECLRSTDCSIRGERICDLSHRVNEQGVVTSRGQGECTIEGCGRGSCPKEAACIKVYGSDFLSIACDPDREDVAVPCDPEAEGEAICEARGCVPSQEAGVWTCPPRDDCDANEVCLPEGLCA